MSQPDINTLAEPIEDHIRNLRGMAEHAFDRQVCCSDVAMLSWADALEEATDALIARYEEAITRLSVLDGTACDEEQADGNGPCGICVNCLRTRCEEVDQPKAVMRTCPYCATSFEVPSPWFHADRCPGCLRAERTERLLHDLRESMVGERVDLLWSNGQLWIDELAKETDGVDELSWVDGDSDSFISDKQATAEATERAERAERAIQRVCDETDYCYLCDCHPSHGHATDCPLVASGPDTPEDA